jgi:cytochrome c-type biogenesis protein CcmE
MKNLKKKRRIHIIVLAFVALVISTALIGYGMRDGINFFLSPTQISESMPPETQVIRLGGLVEEGSIQRGQGATVTFRVTDTNATIDVAYTGVLPDLFEENQGTVVTGRMKDGVFVAQEVLAKHDETYMPKEVIDVLKEQGVYKGAES